MKLDIQGLESCLDYLDKVSSDAPPAAVAGTRAALEVLEAGIRSELDSASPKLLERKNNLRTFFKVGTRTVAIVLPGVHSLIWIAVTGLDAGGSPVRHGFATEDSALGHARRYAAQVRQQEGEAGFTVEVHETDDGAEGTLTSDHQDDDAVQRAWDESETPALEAAEAAIRQAMVPP